VRLPGPVVDELRVRPGEAAGLAARSTARTTERWEEAGDFSKTTADGHLEAFREELSAAQELLIASDRYALLVVIQALDAAGKDGTIKHVMTGVNPQGCRVVAFKQPSAEELNHDYLWRCERALPPRGQIGIFNRSYYEEVLITRVHPELLEAAHLPALPAGKGARARLWQERYEDINAFERHLARNGTKVVKFFLHVSKAEQRRRFLERLDDPNKHWKFSATDVAERAHFDAYQQAYEEALTATSTAWAPWFVVPADHKHAMRALVAGVLVHVVDELDLALPELDAAGLAALEQARRELLAEDD